VVYLHFFGKAINLLSSQRVDSPMPGKDDELFHEFKQVSLGLGILGEIRGFLSFMAGFLNISAKVLGL